ncbi:MAG: hypothetical protein V2A54_02890 [Bacteroidota bacterium]
MESFDGAKIKKVGRPQTEDRKKLSFFKFPFKIEGVDALADGVVEIPGLKQPFNETLTGGREPSSLLRIPLDLHPDYFKCINLINRRNRGELTRALAF